MRVSFHLRLRALLLSKLLIFISTISERDVFILATIGREAIIFRVIKYHD